MASYSIVMTDYRHDAYQATYVASELGLSQLCSNFTQNAFKYYVPV